VKSNVPCEIEYLDSDDVRSYRLNSDKLMNLGFSPIKSVKNAIVDNSKQFKNGLLDDTLETSNVKWMKTLTKENNR
jgi:hypothetical protein